MAKRHQNQEEQIMEDLRQQVLRVAWNWPTPSEFDEGISRINWREEEYQKTGRGFDT